MIKEIQIIADDTVRPIVELPFTSNDEGLALDGPALSDSEHGSHTANCGGRYWDRTSDLFGVNEALSR